MMLWFFAAAAAILALLGAVQYYWAKRVRADIAEGAELAFTRMQELEPDLLDGVDRARFEEIYMRTHFPRFPGYALAAAAAFLAALPLVLGLLAVALYSAEVFGLSPQPVAVADRYLIEDGSMKLITAAPPEAAYYWVQSLGGFYYFFGIVVAWMLIVWFFVRRYHRTRPGYLRDEILRAKQAGAAT